MSRSCVWLDLRSGAPGLPGPYLCEFFSPYRYLDGLGNVRPTIILAVGGQNKRRHLSNHLSVSYNQAETDTVTLRNLALPHMLLVDGELHQRNELPRIKAGPSPGSYDTHELKGAPKSAAEISYRIYFDVLAPFCSVVLLFVSDLNGTGATVDVLARWAKRMMGFPPPALPKVLLFFDDSPAPDSSDIRQQVSMKLLEYLRREPTSAYTFSDAKRIISISYDIHVLTNCPSDAFLDNLISITDNAASQRQDLRLSFSAIHLRHLVQSAIVHFSGRLAGPFNIYRASRANNPVPVTLRECVSNFVHFTKQNHVDSARVVASALVMDAYPPGTHHFCPSDLYRDLYEPILLAVQESEALPDFCWMVKTHFVEIANERERDRMPSAQGHLLLLRALSWDIPLGSISCVFCLAHHARYTLDCKHRICTVCTTICARRIEPWEFQVPNCPLCHCANQGTFRLIPQTAGIRVLRLGGLAPENTWQFLRDLQLASGLLSMPVREQFDTIVAADSGVFFTITYFLEGWTLAECKRRLRNVGRPKITHKKIRFRNGLERPADALRHCNKFGVVVLQGGETAHSNLMHVAAPNDNGCDIEYNGEDYTANWLRQVSEKLLADLFYIEITKAPCFYSSPRILSLQLRCRVQSAPALMDLVTKLHAQQVHVYYRGDEVSYKQGALCTSALVEKCKSTHSFLKEITVTVGSLRSTIDIRIGRTQSEWRSISNCPYVLEQLIHDQGLDGRFGRSGHQPPSPAGESVSLDKELDRLQTVLGPLVKPSR